MSPSLSPQTSFRFTVEESGFLRDAGVHWIFGVLEGDGMDPGVVCRVCGDPELRVVVASVALVNYVDVAMYDSGKFMFSIEPPDFDVQCLRGRTLVPNGDGSGNVSGPEH